MLREHLGVEWANEMVSFPFSADRGTCHPESLQLFGPEGPLAAQFSEIERWPGAAGIRSAKVSFIVAKLPASGQATYTLHYGATPAAASPASDLKIAPAGDSIELSTSRFAIRLLQGERQYPRPTNPADVPGPVAAMRLADGTWFGESRLYGSRPIVGYVANVEERGPVFARVALRYIYDDGQTMDLSARLIAGDSKVTWHMTVRPAAGAAVARSASPASAGGWRLILSAGLDPLLGVLGPEHNDENKWGTRKFTKEDGWIFTPEDVDLRRQPAGIITSLVPWEDWWNSSTQAQWTFKTPSRGEILKVAAVDPANWVEPAAAGEHLKWASAENREKWIPLVRHADESISMEMSASPGERRWQIGVPAPTRSNAERLSVQGAHTWTMPGAQLGVGYRLDQAKDYVLSWPEPREPAHPHLFGSRQDIASARQNISPEELTALRESGRARSGGKKRARSFSASDTDALAAYLATGDPEVAKETQLIERIAGQLALLGNFDLMRHTKVIASLYDGTIDSGLIPAQQRAVLRAQIAYLGYVLADPSTWSVERGYCSNNLNMSISYILNLGLLACVLPEHPLAKAWAKPAIEMCDRWLGEMVGPAGEWPESVANYAHVSATSLLLFAIAAKNAGLHDFIADPRMKRLMLYLAKQYTPPDPRSGGERRPSLSLLPPSGRSAGGKARVIPGLMAKATAASDPAYSQVQQWSWLRSGSSLFVAVSSTGAERFAVDRSLPAATPDWGSDLFPQLGAILRQDVGTKDEWYINVMVPSFSADWVPSEYGAFASIFARGVPIAGAFAGGYAEKEELFMSRVHLARQRGTDDERRQSMYHQGERKLTDFAALPRQDYVAADLSIGKPIYRSLEAGANEHMVPVPEWPSVPKVGSGPVRWRRQMLFVKGDQATEAGYLLLRDTVSGGQPTMWQMWTVSEKIGTPQQTQDIAHFLADKPGHQAMPARELPGDRFTAVGPFGVDTEFYVASPAATPRHTLRWGRTYKVSPIDGFAEYMDLLHLQRTDDGSYYVVMFPRSRAERAPEFQTLADGKIIRIRGDFGTDYAFVAESDQSAKAEGVSFRGTAGTVQNRSNGLVLALGSKGEIASGEYRLSADDAVSLRIGVGVLTIVASRPGPQRIAITAPGDWELAPSASKADLVERNGTFTVTLGESVSQAVLRKK